LLKSATRPDLDLQITFGYLVPVALGYRRDLRDRKAFASRFNMQFQGKSWQVFLQDLLSTSGMCFAIIGALTQICTAFPEIEDIPLILAGNTSATIIPVASQEVA
jgi:hypothetical protein